MRRIQGIQILHFYWSFSSDIVAVKGLRGGVVALNGWLLNVCVVDTVQRRSEGEKELETRGR